MQANSQNILGKNAPPPPPPHPGPQKKFPLYVFMLLYYVEVGVVGKVGMAFLQQV